MLEKEEYSKAYEDISSLGAFLIAQDMKDKNIAIVGKESYEWAVSYLAITCGVGKVVLFDSKLSITEFKQFLIENDCRCVIFSDELKDVFYQIRNDGVTNLDLLINMNIEKEDTVYNMLSLKELLRKRDAEA